MDQISFTINFLIVLVAICSCWYSYRIWKIARYKGMFWLFISLIYATILRIIVFFGYGNIAIPAMIVFWIVLSYALHDILRQTKKVIDK